MRRVIVLVAATALALAVALAYHAQRSDAKWRILADQAINDIQLCRDGTTYQYGNTQAPASPVPPLTPPQGQPAWVAPVNVVLQVRSTSSGTSATNPGSEADWFNAELVGADVFTTPWAPLFDSSSQTYFLYTHQGTVPFRRPLTPTTDIVRYDPLPNGDAFGDLSDPSFQPDNAFVAVRNCFLFAPIDFRPTDPTNTIDFSKQGTPFVGILSRRRVTNGQVLYDATRIDPSTVRVGVTGSEAAPIASQITDLNGDGVPDLQVQVRRVDTGIQRGATSIMLSAVDPRTHARFYESDFVQTIN